MTPDSARIAPVVAALLDRHAAGRAVDLAFEDCVIRVCTNAPALLDRFASDYAPFTCSGRKPDLSITALQAALPDVPGAFTVRPTSSVRGPKESWCDYADGRVIRKVRTGMVFLMSGLHHVAVGDSLANVNQIINFMNSRYLNWLMRDGGHLLHAAGVARGEAGIALTGFSSAGKSTLALRLMTDGWNFVSNDRLVVRRTSAGLQMDGLPKYPRINPGTILNNPALLDILPPERQRALRSLPADELWALEEKYDVNIPERFGSERMRLSAWPRALYVLNWKRIAEPANIRPVDLKGRRDLLPAIMKSRGVFADGPVELGDGTDAPEGYVAGLADFPVYEVTGGVQFDAVARHCHDALDVE